MSFETRFEITLGQLDTASLRRALADAGVLQNAYANRLFDEGHVVPSPQRVVKVVVTNAAELRAPEGETLDVLFARAREVGLVPGPLELAAYLRLAWPDQPTVPRVTVASLRPTPEETSPRGFYLRRDDEGTWLRGYVASDDWVFEPTEGLAFVRT
ncbi:MAG: hypothetical protein R3B99_05330 [Polyangiales bacterium]|nr:hypothetical protein [Myxococcales bacterium]